MILMNISLVHCLLDYWENLQISQELNMGLFRVSMSMKGSMLFMNVSLVQYQPASLQGEITDPPGNEDGTF